MDNSESYWICRGTKQEPHPEYEIEANQNCDICGQDSSSIKSQPKKDLPIGFIAVAIALLLLGGMGAWWFFRPKTANDTSLKTPIEESNGNTQQQQSATGSSLDYSWQPERFTKGQRSLFPGKGNPIRDNGVEAFKRSDYDSAAKAFERAIKADRNDPEVLILYNNALARQKGNPLTLAAVVPVDNNQNSAEEMLRGVALAQHQFNQNGGINGRLLEIAIANDGNQPDNALQVARQFVDDLTVLGVIGHNSSNATQAGLSAYGENLAVISPTSTSNTLKGDSFYRTVPSDTATAQQLAQYVEKTLNLDRVAVFYVPDSSYSNSLTTAFEDSFTGTVVNKVDLSNPDFDSEVEISRNASEKKTQAVLLFPSTQYAPVAIELAQANLALPAQQRLKLLGGSSLYSSDTLTAGGEAVADLTLAVPWFARSAQAQNFTSNAEKQWGGIVNWRTAMSFDATQALIKTLDNNSTRQSVLSGLKQIDVSANEASGAEIKFTEGERQSEPVIVKAVRGGSISPQDSNFGFNLVNK